MDKRLIAANALSFFCIVIVYQAFLTVASPLSAIRLPFSLMQLNLWFMFVSFFGVLLFAYTFRREPSRDLNRLLHASLAANALSVLALAYGLAGETVNYFLLYIGGLVFPLACGYLDSCLFYLLARHTVPQRQGIAVGVYIAFTNGLLFLVQKLVEAVTGAPLFLPWPLLLLSLALIAFLLRPLPAEDTAQLVVPQTQVAEHLPLFCGIGVLLSLLIGLPSTLDFVKYEEYYTNWHAISRLFLVAGYLAAGWLADHYLVWLPIAALLAKVVIFASYIFVLEGAPMWLVFFIATFFGPFIILFIIWMFFNVALRSTRPELWAGMGRAIERPFHILGALAGEILLEHKVSHGVMSLVYMGLLILAVVLLYRLFLLYAEAWKHSAVEETAARVKAEAAAVSLANAAMNAAVYENVETNTAVSTNDDVNAKTATQTSANIFDKSVAMVNNKDTTAKKNVAVVSVDNLADENAEAVYDEAAASDDFAAVVAEAEERAAENSTAALAEKEPAVPLPDDSGPLHGDRLRKYQIRYRLTNRETEVLWEILQRHKIADIAANLFITLPTAKYHISNILQKTGAKNQRELRYLIQKEEM